MFEEEIEALYAERKELEEKIDLLEAGFDVMGADYAMNSNQQFNSRLFKLAQETIESHWNRIYEIEDEISEYRIRMQEDSLIEEAEQLEDFDFWD